MVINFTFAYTKLTPVYAKVILYRQKTLSNGSHPVMIQIFINRKPKRKTLFSIDAKFWDDKNNRVKINHPLHIEYNDMIISRLKDIELSYISEIKEGKNPTGNILKGKTSAMLTDIIKEYQDLLNKPKSRGHSQYSYISRLINENNLDRPYSDINEDWLTTFINKCFQDLHHNTIKKYISKIKTVLRKKKIILDYPMGTKPTTKDKLSLIEFRRLKSLNLSEQGLIEVVRDTFLLSFYLRGLRIGDTITIKKTEIHNGRLVRQARKTDKDINMAIVEPAQEIIDKYNDNKSIYIIPLMKMEQDFESDRYRKQIEAKTTIVNRYLKIIAGMCDIDKNLTSHVARHTFAYLADQFGFTSKRIQDLLQHSDLSTTENYINDLKKNDVLDIAMDEIMKALFG